MRTIVDLLGRFIAIVVTIIILIPFYILFFAALAGVPVFFLSGGARGNPNATQPTVIAAVVGGIVGFLLGIRYLLLKVMFAPLGTFSMAGRQQGHTSANWSPQPWETRPNYAPPDIPQPPPPLPF